LDDILTFDGFSGTKFNILKRRWLPTPILPLLILGVVGVALFASFILKASDDIVFGIVFIGCLTAFLEIKMRNDNRE
jgi:hypothetical protein